MTRPTEAAPVASPPVSSSSSSSPLSQPVQPHPPQAPEERNTNHQLLRLLTVGDGDFSLSLAILRCYGLHNLDLTISTIAPSYQDLLLSLSSSVQDDGNSQSDSHHNSAAARFTYHLQEIHNLYATYHRNSCHNRHPANDDDTAAAAAEYDGTQPRILYGIDACQLHVPHVRQRFVTTNCTVDTAAKGEERDDYTTKLFDVVIFQYPHLGTHPRIRCHNSTTSHTTPEEEGEDILRQRHGSLLHHYLYSASFISHSIHVTINPNQYASWLLWNHPSPPPPNSIPSPLPLHFPPHTTTATTTPFVKIYHGDDDDDDERKIQLQKVIPIQLPFHFIFPSSTTTNTEATWTIYPPPTSAVSSTSSTFMEHPATTHPVKPPQNPAQYQHNQRSKRCSKRYGTTSNHFLHKYGYHHVRTPPPPPLPTTTTTATPPSPPRHTRTTKSTPQPVSLYGSCHYVFQCTSTTAAATTAGTDRMVPPYRCDICHVSVSNFEQLQAHYSTPTVWPIHSSCDSEHTTATTTNIMTTRKSTSPHVEEEMKNHPTAIVPSPSLSIPTAIPSHDRDNFVSTIAGATTATTSTTTASALAQNNEFMVTSEYVGKRLRWFLHNVVGGKTKCSHDTTATAATTTRDCEPQRLMNDTIVTTTNSRTNKNDHHYMYQYSKRQWDSMIRNGCIRINHAVVTDSSRILHESGWIVAIETVQEVGVVVEPPQDDPNRNVTAESPWKHNPITNSFTTTRTVTAVPSCDSNAAGALSTQKEQSFHTNSATIGNKNVIPQHIAMSTNLDIVDTWKIPEPNQARFVIVWKPVGMRTIGNFHASTLEQSLHTQQKQRGVECQYQSLSKLDKGCSGLCAVLERHLGGMVLQQQQQQPVVIRHTFTALVYGHCPQHWRSGISIVLPIDGLRRWKKKGQKQSTNVTLDSPTNDGILEDCIRDPTNSNVAILTLVEQTVTGTTAACMTTTIPALSTVTISTTSKSSGLAQTISYFLRTSITSSSSGHVHPIVGDRMAAQEYISLPRSMRNRLKQRLCFGCTSVGMNINGTNGHDVNDPNFVRKNGSMLQLQPFQYETEITVPTKWSAAYWQDFCMKVSVIESMENQ